MRQPLKLQNYANPSRFSPKGSGHKKACEVSIIFENKVIQGLTSALTRQLNHLIKET